MYDDENEEDSVPATVPEETIRIMLATDNHIGYMERDPVRGRDSIETFREILQLAQDNDVDFILLAGDLFHENKPSRACLHQTIALLREYCLSDKPVQVELLSDPEDGQAAGFSFPAINYEDPNFNVGMPVFSIHGNHDDPQGAGVEGALCALDVLSVAGLVNYFGKVDLPTDDDKAVEASRRAEKGGLAENGIRLRPVLLRKGGTKLAMYGLGNVRDERLHFELRSNRVRMYRPSEEPDSWFNMLLLHQNRVEHNPKSSVPEALFDDSFELVIWGHEHDCRINPEPVPGKRYCIVQPGSSIATSLTKGESLDKHVALLSIRGKEYKVEPILLRTVRPFVMDEVKLAEVEKEESIELKDKAQVHKYLKRRVNELVDEANQRWLEKNPGEEQPTMLPLVRLRVEYTTQEITNPVRFGQEFVDKVANPSDILQFSRKKQAPQKRNKNDIVDVIDEDLIPAEMLEKVRVGTLVKEYLQAQQLEVLYEDGMERAVTNFVEKDDSKAITDFVNSALKGMQKSFGGSVDVTEDSIRNNLAKYKQEYGERMGKKMQIDAPADRGADADADGEEEEEEDDEVQIVEKPNRSRTAALSSGTTTRKKAPARATTKARVETRKATLDFRPSQQASSSSSTRGASTRGASTKGASTRGASTRPAANKASRRIHEEEEDELDELDEAPLFFDDDDDIDDDDFEPEVVPPRKGTTTRSRR